LSRQKGGNRELGRHFAQIVATHPSAGGRRVLNSHGNSSRHGSSGSWRPRQFAACIEVEQLHRRTQESRKPQAALAQGFDSANSADAAFEQEWQVAYGKREIH